MIKNEKGGGNTKTGLVGGQTIMSTYFIKCDVCNKDIITYWCGKPTPLGVGWIALDT